MRRIERKPKALLVGAAGSGRGVALESGLSRPAANLARVTRPKRRRRRPPAKTIVARTAGYIVLVVMSVLCLFPLVWMLLTSLRPNSTVLGSSIIPRKFTFSAYTYVIKHVHIFHYFLNSLYITAATVLLVLAVGSLAGYGFGRIPFRGKGIVFGLLSTALFLPPAATLIPLFLELRSFHMLSNQVGLILVYVGGAVPFAVFLLRVFFESLPTELADAARIDGAGDLRIFWRIMLPLSAPAIGTVAIFQVLGTWNELMFAIALIQKQNLLPLQPELNSLVGEYSTNWSALAAALTITVIPIVVVYVALQKRVVAGLTSGALKG